MDVAILPYGPGRVMLESRSQSAHSYFGSTEPSVAIFPESQLGSWLESFRHAGLVCGRPGDETGRRVDLLLLSVVLVAAAVEALGEGVKALLAAGLVLALALSGRWGAEPPTQGEKASTLERLPVIELRRMAREAGHKDLARSGRKADLVQALTES